MAKPYVPRFQISVTRSFDGKVEGSRTWVISGHAPDIDKLEDCIAFIANSAMDSIPKMLRQPETEESSL